MTYIERSYEEIEEAYKKQVELDKDKNRVTLSIGEIYTPIRILEEIHNKTPFGQQFITFIQDSGKRFDEDPLVFIQEPEQS